ncbi:unnamed protein product [Knipowitschia caucasica]
MASASSGKSVRKNAAKSNPINNRSESASMHDCSVSGSAVNSWDDLIDLDQEEEEVEMSELVNEQRSDKRKRMGSCSSGDDLSTPREKTKMFAIVRFNEKTQVNMKKLSPFILTAELNSKVGDIVSAKVLADGNLLVQCANEVQLNKALNLKQFGKFKVENVGRVGAREGGGCKGVISGVPISVKMDDLKSKIKGGKVISVDRMKTTKGGTKTDSESILIHFEEESVPRKVFLGFMCYPVRAYVPKPMRCFHCQRFGHFAKNCNKRGGVRGVVETMNMGSAETVFNRSAAVVGGVTVWHMLDVRE